ncbi:MAG TPA: CBS and ACT domain-containing protein [Desulfomicrobiaceae bacterium]|nr:CBS and ACT domain-containing protein [Desulfomicrobiaceae bacterium]
MLVNNWMTEGSINLGMETTIIDAAEILRRNNIRQLPVIDSSGKLAGILSDRDIRDAMPSKFLPGGTREGQENNLATLKVKDVMTIDPWTILPDSTVEQAAEQLNKHRIGGLPVQDRDGNLLGIITEVDILNYLCKTTGMDNKSIQFVFKLPDTPGAAIDLLGCLAGEDVRLTSVLSSYEDAEIGFRHVSIRVQNTGKHTMSSLLDLLKTKYRLLYYVHDGRAVTLEA